MTLLPIVARELRVASRRSSSYWGRTVSALVALGVFAWLFAVERHGSTTRMGQSLFSVLSMLAYIFASLAGVMFSADSISREKREGTLGLLFLTDLRGVDVSLGKLTASSLAAVYGLLAVFPVMGVCLLLGGVAGAEYGRMILVLVCVLLTSLALGLVASTVTSDPMRSVVLALVLVCVWQFGPPLAAALGEAALARAGLNDSTRKDLFDGYAYITPFAAKLHAYADGYKAHPQIYQYAVGTCAALGLAALRFASVRLPKVWQIPDARRSWGFRAWLRRLRFRSEQDWLSYRRRLLELHPIVWLSGRHWMRTLMVWLFLGGAAVLYIGIGLLVDEHDWWEGPALLTASFLIHLILTFWAALEAPRQFFSDRRSGALELLLTTPVDLREMAEGKIRAFWRQFFWPAVAVAGLDLYAGLDLVFRNLQDSDWPGFLFFSLMHLAMLFVDLFTIAWVGNWVGLAATGNRTTLHVVLRILVLPAAIWIISATVIGLVTQGRGLGNDGLLVTLPLSWLLLCVINNLVWWSQAKRGLLTAFRDTANGQIRKVAR